MALPEERANDRLISVVTTPGTRRRYGPAETIASDLRSKILSGEVPDGGSLPKLEDLMDEFAVGKGSVREACRILETEGLLTVRRGAKGGSVVSVPTPSNVAYTVGLVLQARGATVSDVLTAIEAFEPTCAELCARRANRAEAVLPEMEAAQAELARSIAMNDGVSASRAARRWHETLAQNCGNETAAVLWGALETVWTSHAQTAAAEYADHGVPFSPEESRDVYVSHEHIQELIRSGNAVEAAAATRQHIHTARLHEHDPDDHSSVIRAETIRDSSVRQPAPGLQPTVRR
jgi:GntR family transcriptional regulator, transcriptional repressor for pyruvate dehydrogenase complex